MADTTATPTSDPTSEPPTDAPESEQRIPFTARIPAELLDELKAYADDVDWSTNSALIACIRGWLWTAKNHWIQPLHEAAAKSWAVTEEAGCGGCSYEIQVTLRLPSQGSDEFAYAAVDEIDQLLLTNLGARDVCTRLVRLAPMSPRPADPRCVEAACAHLTE